MASPEQRASNFSAFIKHPLGEISENFNVRRSVVNKIENNRAGLTQSARDKTSADKALIGCVFRNPNRQLANATLSQLSYRPTR